MRIAIGWLFAVLLPVSLRGQELNLGPRLAIGDGSAMTVQAAVRTELLWQRWGGYAAIGARAATTSCVLGPVRSCTLPDPPAWELTAGLMHTVSDTPLYLSIGGGATRWGGGTDPLVEGEIGLRVPAATSLKLNVGVHGLLVPGVARPYVRSVDVYFVEVVVGLSVGLGRL
jgi:hypothetical protein